MSDIYNFVGQDGNLDNGFNWESTTTGMSGTVPGASDTALIQYAQALAGTLDVASLVLAAANGVPIISLTGSSTQVTAAVMAVIGPALLDEGAAVQANVLELVGGGTSLTLQNRASFADIPSESGSVTIGSTSGSSLLSVAGVDTNFVFSTTGSLLVGDATSSDATVSVNNGGSISGEYGGVLIGAVDGATATMLVSGAGSVAEMDGLVEVGDYGSGSLVVSGGGYASLGGGEGLFIGASDDGTSSSGVVTVVGAGSLLSVDGALFIGETGISVGRVAISAGGEMQVSSDTVIDNGELSVAGAGSVFEGRSVQIDAAAGQLAMAVSSGASISIVTLRLDSGRVALSGGHIAIRRSDVVSSGATLSGSGTVAAGVTHNSGLLIASGGTLSFIGAVDQTGAERIGSGAVLRFDDAVSSGQTVTFAEPTGSLALGDASAFAGLITGFGHSNVIDLLGDTVTGLVLKGGVLTVENGSMTVASLALRGSYAVTNFKLASDGHGGTDITYSTGKTIDSLLHSWQGVI